MPKLKNSKDKDENLLIKAKIQEYKIKRESDTERIATSANMSASSLYQRMRVPSNFKVGELRNIYDYLRVPKEERVGLG